MLNAYLGNISRNESQTWETVQLHYCGHHLSSSANLHKLQRIQNSLARIVTGKHRHEHITPVLARLHWLPVKYRIHFKLEVITFNTLSPKCQTTAKLPGRTTAGPRTSSRSLVRKFTNGYTCHETNWSSPTVPSATQHRPFETDFLLQLLSPVHWNISNGRSKLNYTIVRLTVTDSWHPALMILPSEWLLVHYQPYNII